MSLVEAARLAGDEAARFEKAVTDGGVAGLQVRTLFEAQDVWTRILSRATSAESNTTWLAFRDFCRKESMAERSARPNGPTVWRGEAERDAVSTGGSPVHELYEAVQRVVLPSAEELEGGGKAVHVDEGLMLALFQINSDKFFVRAAYPELYKVLPFEKIGRAAITGTPGIGTSVSALYVLIRRVQEGHPTCFHQLDTCTTWLFADGTCVMSFEAANRFETDRNFVVLLDKANGNPTLFPNTRGLAIVFSSPRHENYHEWLKDNSRGRLFMPPFSLNELLRFREQVHPEVDEANVRRLFDEYGGVVRFIFGDELVQIDYMGLVESELMHKELLLDILRSKPRGLLRDRRQLSHTIVFYDVDDKFKLARLRFASLGMANRFFAAHELGKTAEVFSGLSAEYEKTALRLIPSIRKALVRPLCSPEGSAFRVEEFVEKGCAAVKEFDGEKEMDELLDSAPPGRPEVWRPKSETDACFDGLLWNGQRWYCLQVTIDATKVLKANLLKRFFDRHENLAKEVYVVMPTDVERKVNGPFKYADSADAEWAMTFVSQFAVVLPRFDDSLAGYDEKMTEELKKLKLTLFVASEGNNN
jgi:hypothetical protein